MIQTANKNPIPHTAEKWLNQAADSLRSDDWIEATHCLRAAEQVSNSSDSLTLLTLLARLRLMQGRYDEGNNLLGEPFLPQTRALARLREAFYAARHWRTPCLTLPIVSLETAARAYIESDSPEGSFLDLAQWETWLMRHPDQIKDTSAVLLALWDLGLFSGKRLLPAGLEALLAEKWYDQHTGSSQDYSRKVALESAGDQQEFQTVTIYLRLLQALRAGDKNKFATSFDALYCEAGICLWLRYLPQLAGIGDIARRDRIVFQIDKADVWLENQTGAKIAQTAYAVIIGSVGEHLRQDVALSARAREQWRTYIKL